MNRSRLKRSVAFLIVLFATAGPLMTAEAQELSLTDQVIERHVLEDVAPGSTLDGGDHVLFGLGSGQEDHRSIGSNGRDLGRADRAGVRRCLTPTAAGPSQGILPRRHQFAKFLPGGG